MEFTIEGFRRNFSRTFAPLLTIPLFAQLIALVWQTNTVSGTGNQQCWTFWSMLLKGYHFTIPQPSWTSFSIQSKAFLKPGSLLSGTHSLHNLLSAWFYFRMYRRTISIFFFFFPLSSFACLHCQLCNASSSMFVLLWVHFCSQQCWKGRRMHGCTWNAAHVFGRVYDRDRLEAGMYKDSVSILLGPGLNV